MLRKNRRSRFVACVAAIGLTLSTPVPTVAQGIPVIDIASLVQLIQQVLYWQNQLQQMQSHLDQLRQTYAALTGGRGMQALLPLAPQARNYLPATWSDVTGLTTGGGGAYAGLANLVSSNLQAVAVLPASALALLTADQRKLVTDGRNSTALLQALSQTAYASTSTRFQQMQSLIQAIGSATDTKAINDLQGRIQAEQAMLANDQAKLTVLYQAAQADRWSQEQRTREMSIVQLGSAQKLAPVNY